MSRVVNQKGEGIGESETDELDSGTRMRLTKR